MPAAAGGDSLLRWSTIVAAGIVASNLALPDLLDLPFKNLLRTELNLGRDEVSLFLSLAALPWYFKILAGLLSDSFPIFGTHRRHYLIFSSALAIACWLVVGAVPHAYWPLLFALMATNAMLVIVSTVTAALIVEAGKRLGVEGRLVTVRVIMENACLVVAGPIAGYLAARPFGWTGVAGALIVAATILPAALFVLREPRAAPQRRAGVSRSRREAARGARLRRPLARRTVPDARHRAAGVQRVALFPSGRAGRHFQHRHRISEQPSGARRRGDGLAYAALRPRFTLRTLVVAGLLFGAIAAGSLMFYRSWEAALVIEVVRGTFGMVGSIALMEAAVRATPVSIAAMGFALLMSAWNLGIALGDYAGAWMVQRGVLSFYGLAGLYALLSAMTLLALPLLPRGVFDEPAQAAIDAPKDAH